jgi:hypothetical protein
MTNVTPIRPDNGDELASLINDSEKFVLVCKNGGELEMATNVDPSEVVLMMEGLKLEITAGYLEGIFDINEEEPESVN